MSDDEAPDMLTDIVWESAVIPRIEVDIYSKTLLSPLEECLPYISKSNIEDFLAAVFYPNDAQNLNLSYSHLREIPLQIGAKSRCDAQWYGEGSSIAFGCKTCALSSASCICVACFDAGDHEGHDFYVSKSEYGCCDCGDPFAWKSKGFCRHHSGPTAEIKIGNALQDKCEFLMNKIVSEWTLDLIPLVIKLCSLHDAFRRIGGRKLLATLRAILPTSHLSNGAIQQELASLVVDLMLDTEFKAEFAKSVFSEQYQFLVRARVGLLNPESGRKYMSDLGDFTCQMFTRPDVALSLVEEKSLLKICLETISQILAPAMVSVNPRLVDSTAGHGSDRALVDTLMGQLRASIAAGHDFEVFENSQDEASDTIEEEEVRTIRLLDHAHPMVKDHETVQCGMDLIYLLDHPAVQQSGKLLTDYWPDFLSVMASLHRMNPHRRRISSHVEFPDPNWSSALAIEADLFSSFWLASRELTKESAIEISKQLIDLIKSVPISQNDLYSLHCPLHRLFGILASMVDFPIPYLDDQVIEPPLRAFLLFTQSGLGLWKRNGDSVLMETQFYNAPLFHHHLGSADRAFFKSASSDPKFLPLVFNQIVAESIEDSLLVTLLSFWLNLSSPPITPITLLGVRPRSFSQLRDPQMERWSRSLMPAYLESLEAFVASPQVLPLEGGLYELTPSGWNQIDLVSPAYSWKDMQSVEERFLHCKPDTANWLENAAKLAPNPFLYALVFSALKLVAEQSSADLRVLKLTLHLLFRIGRADAKCQGVVIPAVEASADSTAQALIHNWNGFANIVEGNSVWTFEISGWSIVSLLESLHRAEANAAVRVWLSLAIQLVGGKTEELRLEKTDRKAMQARLMAKLKARQTAFQETHVEETVPEKVQADEHLCVVCRVPGSALPGSLSFIARSATCKTPRFITRTCGHLLHAECGSNVRACPYCSRPANILFGTPGSINALLSLLERLDPGICSEGYLVPLFRLVSDLLDQLVISLGAPSDETDMRSLWDALPLLLSLLGEKAASLVDKKITTMGLLEQTVLNHVLGHPLTLSAFNELRHTDSFRNELLIQLFVDPSHVLPSFDIPSSIIQLPLMYQKLFTPHLSSEYKIPVLCLFCGLLTCFTKVSEHCVSGVILQLSTGLVHIVDAGRIARWGTLYLDAHGEEDVALGKPLTLAPARVALLEAEIREHSWRWRHGAKKLEWRDMARIG